MYTFETHDEKKEKCQCQCKGENEEWRDESDRKRKIERKKKWQTIVVCDTQPHIIYIQKRKHFSSFGRETGRFVRRFKRCYIMYKSSIFVITHLPLAESRPSSFE